MKVAVNGKKYGLIRQCPKCRKQFDNKAEYCGECGEKLVLLCGHCHFPVDKTDTYCPECGAELQNKSGRKNTGWMIGIVLLSIVVGIGCVGTILYFNKKTSKSTEQVDIVKTTEQLKSSSVVVEHATTNSSEIVQKSTVAEESAEREVDLDTVLNAYKEILKESELENEECRFSLANLDDDGIPELVTIDGCNDFSVATIYAYRNHKAVTCGLAGFAGTLYYAKKKNLILSTGGGAGEVFAQYSTIEGSDLVDKDSIRYEVSDMVSLDDIKFYVNEKEVTKEAFAREEDAIYKDKKWKEIYYGNCLEITNDSLEKLIKNDAYCVTDAGDIKISDAIKDEDETAKLDDEMIQIYTDKLYELSAENMEDIGYDCKFMLAYVDDDDIPELLVSEGFFHFSKVSIYVYQNKKLKRVDSLGQLGEMKYDERTGYVQGIYSDMGADTYTYGRLKNGKLKDKIELVDSRNKDFDISEESECWINNEAVSDDEYDTVYEKCEAGRDWTDVTYDNCYDVNADEIYEAFENLKK